MKYFDCIKKVMIDADILGRADQFSKQVVVTTNYDDSKQFSGQKIKNDHFVSKIGEEAAKLVLSKYATVSGPDYNIYEGKQKSWDDDLYIGTTGIAVKTQKRSTGDKFGLSWTFQSGPSRSDLILKRPDAWVVFVEYDDLSRSSCLVFPPYQIKELTFGEPLLDRLKGFKKVVYAKTLILA